MQTINSNSDDASRHLRIEHRLDGGEHMHWATLWMGTATNALGQLPGARSTRLLPRNLMGHQGPSSVFSSTAETTSDEVYQGLDRYEASRSQGRVGCDFWRGDGCGIFTS